MRLENLALVLTIGCLPLMARAQAAAPPDRDVVKDLEYQLREAERKLGGAPRATERKAWLGVGISAAAEALRHQLKLPEGTGLIIDFIEPKSPAANAGLQEFDLLVKLDDQWLVNPEQFAVIVRMQKPDTEVKLTLVREGREQTVSVKLVEHELPKLGVADPLGYWMEARPGFNPQPKLGFERVRLVDEPRRTTTMLDGEREITVSMTDGHRTLVVRTPPGGKVLLAAPIDTPQQMESLPKDVRGILKYMPVPDTNVESAGAAPTTAPSVTP